MKGRKRSLSPAELRYFRIGPKVLDPQDIESRQKINQAIQYKLQTSPLFKFSPSLITLNKLPKPSYGNFQSTVRNFNVLYSKQYGLDTVEHQVQKFGQRARILSAKMISAKKNEDRATSRQKVLRDKIKFISSNKRQVVGHSIKNGIQYKLKLRSFELKGVHSTVSQILPLSYLKILVEHANSSRLQSVIEASLKLNGNHITVEFEKILARISDYKNRDEKYENKQYTFIALGQELRLTVPVLEIISESERVMQTSIVENRDILDIINNSFENVDEILDKYFDQLEFEPMVA